MHRTALTCLTAIGLACASEATPGDATGDTTDDTTAGTTTGAPTTTAATTSAATGETTADGSGSGEDSSSGSVDTGDTSTTGEPTEGLRYDQIAQKSAHNSYQRDEALLDQLVYHRIRSMELDIHVGKTFEPSLPGRWYVYHTDITDDATWCVHLDDCLDAVAAFTSAVDDHEILTLWIDLKDDWDTEHGPGELDLALTEAFGDALLTGAELRDRCGAADAQQALTDPGCGWPELDALRGRVLVVLTGGNGVLRTYHDDDSVDRAALVAPNLDAVADAATWPNTAVFNFAIEELADADAATDAGLVARVWGIEDARAWSAARDAGVHHLGTDMVNVDEDPWARTHDEAGWPFACLGPCTPPPPAEASQVVGVEVDSGDVWSTADSAWFVHDDRSGAPEGTWQAFVSTENSHVEPFVKGCLMARTSLDADAANFAVCRPGDDEPLRIQWRDADGDTTSAIEHDIVAPDTLDAPGAAFVRLRIADDGLCAAGDGSTDGSTWVEIGSACFDAPLVLQGIAASSHDSGITRLLFGGLSHDGGVPLLSDDLGASAAIGSARAVVFDGVFP